MHYVHLRLFLLIALAAASSFRLSSAQVQIPDTVLFDGKTCEVVNNMAYDPQAQPYPTAPKGSQVASVVLSARVTLVGTQKVVGWQWGPLWSGAGSAYGVVIPGSGDTATVTGKAYGPCISEVTCKVHIQDPQNPNTDIYETVHNRCAVIGGPLFFAPASASYPYIGDTFTDGSGNPNPLIYKTQIGPQINEILSLPDHDNNDRSLPYYLQYFGFDPTGPVPTGFQAPRSQLTVNASPGQPGGTTYTWTVSDPNVFKKTAGGGTNDTSLTGSAILQGTTTVTCTYTCSYTNDFDTDTKSAPDDTSQTDWPFPYNKILMVNTIDSHLPTSTAKAFSKIFVTNPPVVFSNGNPVVLSLKTWAGEADEISLVSQLGVRMPGVLVQERYTTTPPSNFAVNQSANFWSTCGSEDLGHLGNFYYDYLRYGWDGLALPWSALTLTHHYWAATQSVAPDGGGIDVGTWDMTFTPGTPGSLGTVSHVKRT